MYAADDAAVRAAAVGFLCCAWSAVRVELAGMIEQSASEGAVSPTMLRRMIAVRNWLPANERAALDRAIKACRQHGVACASWPKAAVGRVLATGIDGSGAHSVNFILLMAASTPSPPCSARSVPGSAMPRSAGTCRRRT